MVSPLIIASPLMVSGAVTDGTYSLELAEEDLVRVEKVLSR